METNIKATQLITFSEYQWSRDKVLALISSVEEFFDDFYDKSLKKKYIWSNVANHMSEKGYTCTGLACDKKWRDLKNSYAYALQQQREGNPSSEFEYFEALHHILGQEIEPDTSGQRISLEEEPDFKDISDDDGFHWDGIEVNLLLDCIMEFQEAFAKPDADLNSVWEDIARHMSHVGEEVSSEQCQRKWLSLEEGYRLHQAQAESTGVVPLWPHYTRTGEVAEAVSVQTTFQTEKTIRIKPQMELCGKNSQKDGSPAKTSFRSSQGGSTPSKAVRGRVCREQGVLARVKHIESSLSVRQRLERLETRVEAFRRQRETTRKTNALLAQVLAELRRINGTLRQDSPMGGKVQVLPGQSSHPGSCSPKNQQEYIIVEAYADPL